MGIVEYTALGLLGELDKTTQEFYGFIMPAIDMYEDRNDLVIAIYYQLRHQESEQQRNQNRCFVYTLDKDQYE